MMQSAVYRRQAATLANRVVRRQIMTPSSLRNNNNSTRPKRMSTKTDNLVLRRRLQHSTTNKNIIKNNSKKHHSTLTQQQQQQGSMATTTTTNTPTQLQLRRVFMAAAIPMVGFGFMDQTVMIQAGNMIDCTIGVTFGLSTLTAAAIGQICSDGSGILFGSTLESLFGLPSPHLSEAQRIMPLVKRTQFAGAFIGVMVGCILGLSNLLLIDTSRSSTLKWQAFQDEQEFEFAIEASNAQRSDATALTVRGPDVDGILASMTAALAMKGCSLVELQAKRNVDDQDAAVQQEIDSSSSGAMPSIHDVFYVVQRDTGEQFPDDELPDLAQTLLDATRTPMNISSVTGALQEKEQENSILRARVEKLEAVVQEKQINVVPTASL